MSDSNYGRGREQPRSILKNSRYSIPDMAPGDPRQNSSRISREWANEGSGGSNSTTTSATNNEGSGNYRHKLAELIARKNEMLFKPLTQDEMPLAEVKGCHQNTEDHYGVVPSLDHFLRVNATDIRRYFFQNLLVGDILIATIYSKNSSGLTMKLLSTDGGKHVVLEDLGIKAFCPSSQTIPPAAKNYDYQIDDYVRVEVIEVSIDSEKIICGMKGVTQSPEMQHTFHLGIISKQDFPRQFSLAKVDSESRSRKTYQEMMLSSCGFQNPNSIGHLASSMGIMSNQNSLMVGMRSAFPPSECAPYLRRVQNGKWAHANVSDGIKFFKSGKYTEAFQCLNKALTIDAENVEGLVARGALYANNAGYEKAIEDFEAALKYNPNHLNARKYLAETLVALGKQQESAGKLEDAVASYSKCLVVKSDHKEAKEALWSLFDRTNRLDIAKIGGTAAVKLNELKEKLKSILQTELGMNVDSKNGKDKKSKKKKNKKSSGSDSSSSSSSDSESDSSSSEESDKGKKRKKSKKKKKRSKKSKKGKAAGDAKRDASLSPFSKRLIDPTGQGASGSGLAGFSEQSFAQWGQQLGIAKLEKNELEEQSKRSSLKKSKDKKRSKKKKRKRSSSSSSDSNSSNEKRKSKSTLLNSSQTLIPDLSDLEAKLSAYYSKIEQDKLEPPIHRAPTVQVTVGRDDMEYGTRDMYDDPMRKIELRSDIHMQPVPEVEYSRSGGWTDKKMGKIKLQTDSYGNFLQQESLTLVRTVHNEPPPIMIPQHEPKPIKFEIKKVAPPPPPQAQQLENAEPVQKWRPFGAPPPPEIEKKPNIKNPFELKKFDSGKDVEIVEKRNFRERRSSSRNRRRRSKSRSRSSSSGSRSSKSRSRSPSYRDRNRGRSWGRFNDRRDYRDRDQDYRRDYRDRDRGRNERGGGGVRFFRGFNPRGGRRPFRGGGRGRHHSYRPNGPKDSKFRNRFSRSASRSSRDSRSNSESPRRRSVSKSLLSKSPENRRDRSESGDRKDRRPSVEAVTAAEDHGETKAGVE